MVPNCRGMVSSQQTVSTSPASLLSPKPRLGSSVLPLGFSLHSPHFLLCFEYLDQLSLFFILLEVASSFHSGFQHLEHGIALHRRLFGAWIALCLPAALASPLGKQTLGHREGN